VRCACSLLQFIIIACLIVVSSFGFIGLLLVQLRPSALFLCFVYEQVFKTLRLAKQGFS
jgi:uncharacterized membrane protein